MVSESDERNHRWTVKMETHPEGVAESSIGETNCRPAVFFAIQAFLALGALYLLHENLTKRRFVLSP